MFENCSKALRTLSGAALIFQSAACGTIMYPERKGQKAGKIDVTVAALDAVGLLFFIIPGVIAFAVDFNNGTIYLPQGGKGLLNRNDLEKVRFEPGAGARSGVEKILRERTGLDLRLGRPDLEAFRLKSVDEIPARFAAYQTRQAFVATIGSPALQENAFANSAEFDSGPITRQRAAE